MLDALPALTEADPWFARRGRHLDVRFLVGVGDREWLVRVHRGRVEAVEPIGGVAQSWDFAIRGTADGWAEFWQPVPPPQRNDLFALAKHGLLRIEGNLHPLFANLLWFKALLALPRKQGRAA